LAVELPPQVGHLLGMLTVRASAIEPELVRSAPRTTTEFFRQ